MSNEHVHPTFRSILDAISPPEDRITRARKLGLPTNVEAVPSGVDKWYAGLGVDVHRVRVTPDDLFLTGQLCNSEKEAIDVARGLRIKEIDRLQTEVNALDERYDKLEDEEIALEKRRINDPD